MIGLYNHRACYGKTIERIEGEGGLEPRAVIYFTDGTTLEVQGIDSLSLSVPQFPVDQNVDAA